jgi:Ca2+-binding EF-hand superfamily protein
VRPTRQDQFAKVAPMNAGKPPKKSAMLEIRLPYETKQSFMRRCRALGISASEVVRGQIESFLAASASSQESPMKSHYAEAALRFASRPQAALVAAAAAIAVALIATPSRALPDLHALFNRFDANHDGTLTLDEFRAAMADDQHIQIRTVHASAPAGAHAEGPRIVTRGPIIIPMHGEGPAAGPPPMQGARPSAEEMRDLTGREFSRMDMDGDATVSYAEFETTHVAMLRASFVALDDNQDGKIDAAEFAIGAPGDGDQAHAQAQAARIVADLDRNGDHLVDWAEFSEAQVAAHQP